MEEVVPGVLKGGAQEDKGDTARLQYFVGAIAIGDLVKSTMGPRGMDKILLPMQTGGHSGKTVITNDGATILKSIYMDNPAAKILVDVSLQQDAECGDGTTGVVVLASELLRNAEQLIDGMIHPQIIIQGYRLATTAAREALEKVSFDEGNNPEKLRSHLMNIARTTLSSKLLAQEKDHFATLAVDAVMRLKNKPNMLELVQIIKKPGSTLKDSFLEEGFILEKRIGIGQPRVMHDCKIMVANTPMDTDKVKLYGARVKVGSFEDVHSIEMAEKKKMKTKVEKILSHNCNVFINRQLIYNYPDQLFKDAGVMAIEHSDFDGMERLAACLGGNIISTFDTPGEAKLGRCKKIEEMMIGDDKVIRFSGCEQGEACSIVLRGASDHILDEAERSLHDALAVLSQTLTNTKVVYGGGAAEMAMATAVDSLARNEQGKKSIAIEAFAKALCQIPTIILDNGGFDSAEIVSNMRSAHTKGKFSMGIDIENGCVGDLKDIGIMESYKSKLAQLCAAAEAAEMIIRVDDIIRCAQRERTGM